MKLKNFKRENMIPLPVTLISTANKEGIRNIAPYSCVVTILRPTNLVCIASAMMRDTYVNIEETGEFVINMISADMVDAVIPTSSHVSFEVDEYELAGLEATESKKVSAPGIKGAYSQMECKLTKIYKDKDPIGIPYLLIIGEVVHLEVDDDCLDEEYGVLDLNKVKPLMILESDKGMHFCTIEDLNKFETFGAMFSDGKDSLEWMYEGD